MTGGAGYIGGQTVLSLLDCGYDVSVLDDLSTGSHHEFHNRTHFYEGRIHDQALVKEIITQHGIRSVLHFAGSIKVDESVSNPLKYYENNTEGSRALIEACVAGGVAHFIFSSTAAVYGRTPSQPVSEDDETVPLNPYGWSKLFTERLLEDVAATGALKYGIFRYFNVAGADPAMRHGQYQEQPVHLIGRSIDALLGGGPPLTIFGGNLPTADGTGVRDYIHVADVADAHVSLLEYLQNGGLNQRLNLGYGRGYSVLEVINALQIVTNRDVPFSFGEARSGEAPSVVANTARLQALLNWQPKHDSLSEILQTSFSWQAALSGGGRE